jgi:hypothetical protein
LSIVMLSRHPAIANARIFRNSFPLRSGALGFLRAIPRRGGNLDSATQEFRASFE